MTKKLTFAERVITYVGDPPDECQVCSQPIKSMFVDGRTQAGPWANLCVTCHAFYGVGLGTGHGQLYAITGDGLFQKVWG